VAIVAAGCSSSSNGNKTGNGNNGQPSAAANVFNAGTTGIRNVSTKKGGTLNLIADSDCDYYDPARTYYGHCWDMQRLFSRGLMAYAPKPGQAGLDVVPDIADGLGQSSDGKTWTYKLKSGIKYEDGTAVTSKDVKYAIER